MQRNEADILILLARYGNRSLPKTSILVRCRASGMILDVAGSAFERDASDQVTGPECGVCDSIFSTGWVSGVRHRVQSRQDHWTIHEGDHAQVHPAGELRPILWGI